MKSTATLYLANARQRLAEDPTIPELEALAAEIDGMVHGEYVALAMTEAAFGRLVSLGARVNRQLIKARDAA